MVMTVPPTLAPPAAGDARSQKSSAAFRTISEVADELDVAQHVLRFWESKFPQVRPLKRGGGRRYYRPEDVDLLRQIRSLLYDEGYTIKGAQKLLRARRAARIPAVEAERHGAAAIAAPAVEPGRSAGLAEIQAEPELAADTRQQLHELREELVELQLLLRRAREPA